jgi:hypothetical protein
MCRAPQPERIATVNELRLSSRQFSLIEEGTTRSKNHNMTRMVAVHFMTVCEQFLASIEQQGGLTTEEFRMIKRYISMLHHLLPQKNPSSADVD